LIWERFLIQKNAAWHSALIVREKANYPKKLGALMSAQDVEAVGLLRKKRKLLKRIEYKRKMIESGKLD
jgi:hypothetical protein